MLAAAATWWLASGDSPLESSPAEKGATSAAIDVDSGPATSPAPTSADPLPSGDSDSILAAWEKQWKAERKHPNSGQYEVEVAQPYHGGTLDMFTEQSDSASSESVYSVACMLKSESVQPSKKLYIGLVDDCLAPALHDGERAELVAWLNKQKDSTEYAYADFARFTMIRAFAPSQGLFLKITSQPILEGVHSPAPAQ
ncbi:hypothetical protein [Actinoplanes sp. NPDC051851]|uniref:hypothetical protein n=1 Tax=Actinoplanes sp. NPDC051851 TaxID=3154753 RepID=UPI00341682E5